MKSLGWGDPVEEPIILIYRRKGERWEHDFRGPVAVLGEDRWKLTWLSREELPLRDGKKLDLTAVPVVGIGGKRKHQPGRMIAFLEANPDFQGAILLYPGTGDFDLGEGMLFVTSREVLSGKRISGGKPVEKLVNFRWLRDGRYLADRALVLHQRIIKILENDVEEEPGPAVIAAELCRPSLYGPLPFRGEYRTPLIEKLRQNVLDVLAELNKREWSRAAAAEAVLGKEHELAQLRDMRARVREFLTEKLREAGVHYVRDVPENLVIRAEEVSPDLFGEDLGTVEIPGVGRRAVQKATPLINAKLMPVEVELTLEEFYQRATAWPFRKLVPVLKGFGALGGASLELALSEPDPVERLTKLRELYSRRFGEKMSRAQA